MTPPSTPPTFGCWKVAAKVGVFTRSKLLDSGLRVRKEEPPLAFMDDGEWRFSLYSTKQCIQIRPDLADRRRLIARFATHSDKFGYLDLERQTIRQLPTSSFNVKDAIYRSMDYKNHTKGIKLPTFHYSKSKLFAEKIYLRNSECTNWVVLDLDNHSPTKKSLDAHLKLLEHLVRHMPKIRQSFGEMSVFYDYQQDCPKGIHIWLYFKIKRPTKLIISRLRTVLASISDKGLDKELISQNLKPISKLEILPTEKQLMQFFGTAGREVFTTQRLVPVNSSFDSKSLLDHLDNWQHNGDPVKRYSELALLLDFNKEPELAIPVIEVDPIIELASTANPATKLNYFTNLVDQCVRGVTVPDELFEYSLRPIATALWFRDLFNDPDKAKLIKSLILNWVIQKHNGLVTRIKKDDIQGLERQIEGVVKFLPKTPERIQEYWEKVRMKDKQYPHKVVSLVEAMEAEQSAAVISKSELIKKGLESVEYKGSNDKYISSHCIGGHFNSSAVTQPINHPIPGTVLEAIKKALLRNHQRKGKVFNRKLNFCQWLVEEIGPLGKKRINRNKLNKAAGYKLGTDQKTLRRYKKLLEKGNILKPNSGRAIVRGKKCSLYQLTDWVVDEWCRQAPRQ